MDVGRIETTLGTRAATSVTRTVPLRIAIELMELTPETPETTVGTTTLESKLEELDETPKALGRAVLSTPGMANAIALGRLEIISAKAV